jgi:hypothetical protein
LLSLEQTLPKKFHQIGEPIWARYNSPLILPLFRTNEAWVEVQ